MPERKQEVEEKHNTLLNSITDSVYILDREWRHVLVNDAREVVVC